MNRCPSFKDFLKTLSIPIVWITLPSVTNGNRCAGWRFLPFPRIATRVLGSHVNPSTLC